METIQINFSKNQGNMKPLHGVNNAPFAWGQEEYVKEAFQYAGIPFCRLHDTQGAFGGSHFVDIPNVFPDFDKDPENPESYDFVFTDAFLKQVVEAGTKIVYRLGVTIEWGPKKYNIYPPADYEKWAKICEGIIRHYNEGWADGHYYNIEYWEIWNEPENPPMWTGTKEEYFVLYETASKYLKNKFPHLKIGGYGSCGFYAVTRENPSIEQKDFVTYFEDFLSFIKANGAPFDFFSWHYYGKNVEEVVAQSQFIRQTLNNNGFDNTETSLNEWNYYDSQNGGIEGAHNMNGAAFIAGVMCQMQNSGTLDSAMYYVATLNAYYNALFDPVTKNYRKQFYSLIAFNHLYQLGEAAESNTDIKGLYVCAACSNYSKAILVVNSTGRGIDADLEIVGIEGDSETFSIMLLDDTHNLERIGTIRCGDVDILKLHFNNNAVYLLKTLAD